MRIIFSIVILVFLPFISFGQGNTCANADPFCSGSGVVFPNTSSGATAQSGPSYGCLSTRPNPAWYYMQIGNSGSITMTISQTSNSTGNGIDVDFIIWGPYSSLTNICTSLTGSCSGSHNCSGNIVDCSYSTAAIETATIPNAISGQYYMVLITNYNGAPGTIDFSQSGGTGTSNCGILYPCLAFAGNDTTICINQSITLGETPAATGNGNINYSWTPSLGLSDTTVANPIATPLQTTTYYLTMIDDSSCTAYDSIIVTVRNPIANAGLDDTLTCQDVTVNLDGSGSTPAVYSWTSIGGSIISGGTTTSPLVGQTGLYIITANEFGCIDTDTVEIFQDASLPVVIAGSDTMVTCLVDTIQLSGFVSGNNLQYYWTGSSIISGDSTLNPVVVGVGSYVLTAIDTVNSCQLSSTVNVFDGRIPPTVTAGSTSNLTCVVQSLDLNGTGSQTGSNIGYLWSTSNGSIVSGVDSIIAVTNMAGTYTFTVYDSLSGCFASDNVIIGADTALPIAIAVDTSLNCATGLTGVPMNGTNSQQGINITYSWQASNGGNILVGGNTNYPLVNAPGTYTITVTNSSNGCVNSDAATVVIDTLVPVANAGVDTTISCINSSLDGSQSSVGSNITYLWTGPFVQSGSTTLNPTVSAGGTYVLMVKNTFNECISYDTVVVVTDLTPPTIFAGLDDTICSGEELMLNGITTGDVITWTTVGGNIVSGGSTINPTIDQGGIYTVTAQNSVNGCSSSSNVTIIENVVSAVIGANPISGQVPLTVSFVNLGIADSSYWNFANGETFGDTSATSSYTTIYTEQGTYVVSLTSVVGECSITKQIIIEVIGTSFLDSIPNVFTPNGDGKNDVFEFVVQQNITELNCVIYNRWGKQVAEITKPDGFWDGKISGSPVADGTYFYVIIAKGMDDVDYKIKGTVTIVR